MMVKKNAVISLQSPKEHRHSSEGWNPVLRIVKTYGGLGPSLRWDDAISKLGIHHHDR